MRQEAQPTDGLVVGGVEGSEGRAEGTLHLLVHGVVLVVGLQHRCVCDDSLSAECRDTRVLRRSGRRLTSVHDGGVAVEDQSALVQSRDGVQQVEGPQVPLTPAVKAENWTLTRKTMHDQQNPRN